MFLGCVIRQSQADVAHISLLFLLPSEFERRKSLTFVKRDSRRVNCDAGSVTLKLKACLDFFCMAKERRDCSDGEVQRVGGGRGFGS